MFPQSDVIKILNHLKRKYKQQFYYKMLYGEAEITRVKMDFWGQPLIEAGTVETKCFSFDEILKWHKCPEKEFERSWNNNG